MVSVIFGSSYHVDVSSNVNFPYQFGFNFLFDAIKKGFHVTIDSRALLTTESDGCVGRDLKGRLQP